MFDLEKMFGWRDDIRENEVCFSATVKELNVIVSAMYMPAGTRFQFNNDTKGVTKTYQVLNGLAILMNGQKTTASICRPGKHMCIKNDTAQSAVVLMIESYETESEEL